MIFLTELLVLSISKFPPVLNALHHNHNSPKIRWSVCFCRKKKKSRFVDWSQLMRNMVLSSFCGGELHYPQFQCQVWLLGQIFYLRSPQMLAISCSCLFRCTKHQHLLQLISRDPDITNKDEFGKTTNFFFFFLHLSPVTIPALTVATFTFG